MEIKTIADILTLWTERFDHFTFTDGKGRKVVKRWTDDSHLMIEWSDGAVSSLLKSVEAVVRGNVIGNSAIDVVHVFRPVLLRDIK